MKKKPTILEALREERKKDSESYPSQLVDLRNAEMASELPHPQCCDTAKKYIFAYQDVDYRTESVRNDGKPRWKSTFSTDYRGDSWGSASLPLTFCPFCGTTLPDMQKRRDPPPVVQTYQDFNYCATCEERLSSCMCSHPESAWEPVP